MLTKLTLEAKSLDAPDEQRTMDHGRLDVVNMSGATIARATFQPGWRWSTDLAPQVGTTSCQVAHRGLIVSGHFHVRMDDGREHDLHAGDTYVIAPGHDAWVLGGDEVVAVDFIATGAALGGSVLRCPCGVEFRVAGDDQLDHLVDAVQEHASSSHGHALAREEILAEVSAA